MTSFKMRSFEIPASTAFWYRMALLDVQQALIDSMGEMDRETFDVIFDGITVRYDELWTNREQAKTTA